MYLLRTNRVTFWIKCDVFRNREIVRKCQENTNSSIDVVSAKNFLAHLTIERDIARNVYMEMKKELLSIFKGILYVCVVYWTVVTFTTGTFTTWLILMGFNIFYLQWTNSLTFPSVFKNGILIGGLLIFFKFLSRFGGSGYVFGILAIVALILISRRKKFLDIKHQGETMIWGKPLKDFKGKPPKIKIVR